MTGTRSWGTRAALAMSALALLVSIGGTAFGGGDLFNDIGSSPFQEEINRIGRAGCASGFPDGSFKPRDGVNRQQFAFWTNNCGGRVANDTGGNLVLTDSDTAGVVADVTITSGATASGAAQGGFVLVNATLGVRVSTDAAQCPCRITSFINDVTAANDQGLRQTTLGAAIDSQGVSQEALANTTVFTIGPEETKTFQLVAEYEDDTDPDITVFGELTAVFIPFGADGDRALDVGP